MRRADARGRVLLALASLMAAFAAPDEGLAAEFDLSSAPLGASSCTGCHGPPAVAIPPLAGRPAAEIAGAFEDFRLGRRPATVMSRIAPGFTPDESRAIAEWFAGQRAAR